MKNKQTAVEWLVEQLRMQTPLYTKNEMIEMAKEMEKEKEHELKQFWFGRGILAAKEDRISELKPKKES